MVDSDSADDLDQRYEFLPDVRALILEACYIEGTVEIETTLHPEDGAGSEWLDIQVNMVGNEGDLDPDGSSLIFVSSLATVYPEWPSIHWCPCFSKRPGTPEDWINLIGSIGGTEVHITVNNCANSKEVSAPRWQWPQLRLKRNGG